MAELRFDQTKQGKIYYESTLPKLIRALEKIGTEMERANDIAERMLPAQDPSMQSKKAWFDSKVQEGEETKE